MSAKRIAVSLALLCGLIAPAKALAAPAPAPAWKLSAVSLPTNFAPATTGENSNTGPMYFPVATNVGAAPTAGEITATITLPAGITPLSAGGGSSHPGSGLTCAPIVSQVVTCKTTDSIPPGHWLGIKVVVEVSAAASGVLVPEASIVGGGAGEVRTETPTPIDTEPAPFEILDFKAPLTMEDGSPATQAGSHPTRLTVDLGFPVEKVSDFVLTSTEHVRDVTVDLPRGVIANPAATPVRCTEAELTSESCPPASQVGVVTVMTNLEGPVSVPQPLYNMAPPPGVIGMLGFDAVGVGLYVHVIGVVRSDGDYGLTGAVNDILAVARYPVLGTQTQLWGDPTSPVHDTIRKCPGQPLGNCPVDPAERTGLAFLTMPSECTGEPPLTVARADSWETPGVFAEASYEHASLDGVPAALAGCNQLDFQPQIKAQPTTNLTDSPSGLGFDLHQRQEFDLEGLSTAALRDALVTLPEGMVANPSQADGLAACSPAEVGLTTEVEEFPIRFEKASPSCPDAAKLGSVAVSTPVLEDPLPGDGGLGAVYLAEPFDNPFGSLLAIYIVIDDPKTGTVAKLAGEVQADPLTGQLTSFFEENPQLPLEDIELDFFGGPRAPLRTPLSCANPATNPPSPHTTFADFLPWSFPEGAEVLTSDSFTLSGAPGGGPCAQSPAAAPHSPRLSAGTVNPQAGAYTPFVLKLSREDGSQEINGFEATLAPGLSGKLAGIATCSEAEIAAARARGEPEEGALERASPSCPAASQLGVVNAAAGAGITPFQVQGRVYLAPPYKGAPLSFVVITPAVAGPFDLGTVVVRAAAYLDPKTAQVRAVSDPLPQILEGIPLDLRSATVSMNRSQFTLNPTSCDPMSIEALATSVFGQAASLADRFQVGGCAALPFKPKLALRLLGGTRRGAHPKFRAILTGRPGDANIARATISLPRSEFVDQSHIRTVCTRVQFAAEQCPPGSIYGEVKASTPLLEETLEGPVYLRSSDNVLPDAVAVLRGPPSRPLQVEGAARIDSVRGGGVRINIDTVPDVPIGKVVVTMQGGRKGLLINSRNLCARTNRATVQMDGQNGKAHDFRPALKNDCKKKKKKKGKRGRQGRARS